MHDVNLLSFLNRCGKHASIRSCFCNLCMTPFFMALRWFHVFERQKAFRPPDKGWALALRRFSVRSSCGPKQPFGEERDVIMSKRLCLAASMLVVASLILTAAGISAESSQAFRQENGLVAYAPPDWFLEGYFMACERNPSFVFGPVQNFVQAIGGTTTWLIEDLELKRLERASLDGNTPEYSLFLEVVSPERTEYWVFVLLPYEDAQAWFDARRAYHGRKAADYYGKTQGELERALSRGLKIKAEVRFLIEKGDISLQLPEDAIMSRYKFHPGRWLDQAAKTK